MSSTFRHSASLVLNLVLAMTAAFLVWHRPEPAPGVAPASEAPPLETPVLIQPQPQLPRYMETASAADKRRWLVDQLRALGVPNNIRARIVLEALDKEWNRHSAEVLWKTHGDDDALSAVQLEMDMSMDGQMRAAMGAADFKQWDQQNMLRDAMRTKVELSDPEAEAIYDLKKKRQQRELELRQALQKGEIDQTDVRDASAKADAELTGQIKSLLGDERYAKSQRLDETVATADLRQDFAKASPSDSQFQELLKTQQQWNEQRSALDKQAANDPAQSAAYADKIKALDAARDQEYKRVIGSDAFDALQKEQDGGYAKMKKYGTLWGLDANKMDAVYGTMQYYQKNVQDYQDRARALEAQGQSVDWEGVNKNLQQFKEQTQQSLQNSLGPDSFNKLQQNGVLYQFTQNQPAPGP